MTGLMHCKASDDISVQLVRHSPRNRTQKKEIPINLFKFLLLAFKVHLEGFRCWELTGTTWITVTSRIGHTWGDFESLYEVLVLFWERGFDRNYLLEVLHCETFPNGTYRIRCNQSYCELKQAESNCERQAMRRFHHLCDQHYPPASSGDVQSETCAVGREE